MRKLILYFILSLSTAEAQEACRYRVLNRGVIKQENIDTIVAWAKQAPMEAFAYGPNYDIFNIISPVLGPWTSYKKRQASIVSVLLVHSMFESSGNWQEGLDTSKPQHLQRDCMATEAGAFQTSPDVLVNFAGDVKRLYEERCLGYPGNTCLKFQRCSKGDKFFAIETAALMYRRKNGYRHYGPIRRKEVNAWLRPACVKEIEKLL